MCNDAGLLFLEDVVSYGVAKEAASFVLAQLTLCCVLDKGGGFASEKARDTSKREIACRFAELLPWRWVGWDICVVSAVALCTLGYSLARSLHERV